MAVRYKQRCARCKQNYVLVTSRQKYAVCYECQKNELKGEISDPKMKKFFDIPQELYKENAFLRDIKINYLRYGKLSERQVEAFKKVVQKMQENIQKEQQ
jgi:hypothetical protein